MSISEHSPMWSREREERDDSLKCECEERFRSACEKLEFYGEHEGKQFCVLHFPSEDKKDDFEKVLKIKLGDEDFDFGGAFFPSGTAQFENFEFRSSAIFSEATFCGMANFREAQFSGERTDFLRAQFSGERTDFRRAQFSAKRTYFGAHFNGEETYFGRAQFRGEETYFWAQFSGKRTYFRRAEFSGERTDFEGAEFSGERTDFRRAYFTAAETSFEDATFSKEVFFEGTTFKEKVAFLGTKENAVFGPQSWVRFDHARIDKPELLMFNTVTLHPSWFINVDVRKVDFTDVLWYGLPGGPEWKFDDEIKALEERGVESPYTSLAQACQRLAANAEDNRNHADASGFNYWAMEAQRKGKPASAVAPWRLIWWYWALSGYGERPVRSGVWLLVILLGFAVLYMWLGHMQVEGFSIAGFWQAFSWQAFSEAVVYSFGVMSRQTARLADTEPKLLRTLVFLEGILGPLQVALFALALRRKFMRGKG